MLAGDANVELALFSIGQTAHNEDSVNNTRTSGPSKVATQVLVHFS